MPMSMLLRSFFITTISSQPFLLIPSLRLLAFLARADKGFIFNVDRNPVLHAILKKTVYNQFCAGETLKETSSCVRQLKCLGFQGVILTYAKELVYDRNNATLHSQENMGAHDVDIDEWQANTSMTVDLLEKGDILAIKYVMVSPCDTIILREFAALTLPQNDWSRPCSCACLHEGHKTSAAVL
jgi:hypothetical protein